MTLALSVNFVTVPGRFLAAASNEYLKQAVLLFVALCVLLLTRRWRSRVGVASWPLVAFALLVFYCSLTLLWSESLADSLRYINKLWLAAALTALVLTVRTADYPRVLSVLESVMAAFLVLTIASELVLRDFLYPGRIGDARLVGFSDVHSTKYLASIAGIVFLVRALMTRRLRWIGLAAGSLIIMTLSLQRAIIGAAIGAITFVVMLLLIWKRRVGVAVAGLVMIAVTVAGGTYLLFDYAPLRSRMFPTEAHATVAQQLLLSGRALEAYGLVQMHGREEFWAVAGSAERGIGGLGFGVVGSQIERAIGEYWQMHNDYLKLLVETGPTGVALYGVLIAALVSAVTRGVWRARTPFGAMLFMMAGGCFLIAPLNGMFDNALDHVQKNVFFGLGFLIMAARWEADSPVPNASSTTLAARQE